MIVFENFKLQKYLFHRFLQNDFTFLNIYGMLFNKY